MDETQRQLIMALFGLLALGFFGLALRRRRQGRVLATTGAALVRWQYSPAEWADFVRAERARAWADLRGRLVWVALAALGPLAGLSGLGLALDGAPGMRALLPAGLAIGAGAAALIAVIQIAQVAQRGTLTTRRSGAPQELAIGTAGYSEGGRLRGFYLDREVRLLGAAPLVLEVTGCATHQGVRRVAQVERLPVPHGAAAEAAVLVQQLQKGS